jgi:hypothetical protein
VHLVGCRITKKRAKLPPILDYPMYPGNLSFQLSGGKSSHWGPGSWYAENEWVKDEAKDPFRHKLVQDFCLPEGGKRQRFVIDAIHDTVSFFSWLINMHRDSKYSTVTFLLEARARFSCRHDTENCEYQ